MTESKISGLAHDALTEVINIAMGNAATRLSKMLKDDVILSVPQVMVVTREAAVMRLPGMGVVPLVAVRERFTGEFSGCALLIFPEANSFELVRAALPEDCDAADIPAFRYEALNEIGNVILNGALSSIANSLHRSFLISLPEQLNGNGREILFGGEGCSPHEFILFVQVDFVVNAQSVSGYVLLTLDLPQLDELKAILDQLIETVVKAAS